MPIKIPVTLSLIFFAICAYVLQAQILLNGDVGYLLEVTHRFLTGGTYGRDFLETNPPMILYLYSPIVMLHQLTELNVIVGIRCWILFWAFVSIVSCLGLLGKFMDPAPARGTLRLDTWVCAILIFILYFLPVGEFGQREHLFLMLVLPYCFAACLRVVNISIPTFFAILIGLMAGLGLGLKPFFLAPVILIELYLLFVRCDWRLCLRPEAVSGFSILVIYLISIYQLAPTYFSITLPLVNLFYFPSSADTWSRFFLRPGTVCCLSMLVVYFMFPKLPTLKHLNRIMLLAFIGMMLAFTIPRSAWYYHVIPAISTGCLLMTICLYQLYQIALDSPTPLLLKDKILLNLFTLLIFLVPILFTTHNLQDEFTYRDDQMGPLISFIQHEPIKSVYCFGGNTTTICFPLVQLTHREFGGRGPFFWWLRILLQKQHDHVALSPRMQADKERLIDMIAEDLNRYKTNIIVTDRDATKALYGKNFDYAQYFSENKNFKAAWAPYHYYASVGPYNLFKRS